MTIWHVAYSVAAYLAAGLCIYTAVQRGFPKGIREASIFALLVIRFWLVESWAVHVDAYHR
jgi:hypothetical protein